MPRRFFLFGLGFSGRAIARALVDQGWQVFATNRSGQKVDGLDGVDIHRFSRQHPLAPHVLAGVTHVLSSVPPDDIGDPVLDMMGSVLAAMPVRWAGYLSTTGIYGDRGGDWVDETSDPRPDLDRSKRRLDAETRWLISGLPSHVFRLAGIYGPGRSAIDTARRGEARLVDKPGQVFSRIHVDDIANTILASMERPNPGAIYNVCDDEPTSPVDVTRHACALLGVVPPPLVPWDRARENLSPMALSFYADNKRVRNDRIKRELGVKLRYPSYRQGLAAILEKGE